MRWNKRGRRRNDGTTYLITMSAAMICWLLATGGLPGNAGAAITLYAPVFLAAVFVMGAGAEWVEVRKGAGAA